MSNPNPPPTTTSAQTPPATPAQMMTLITELHSELTAQRSSIAQLTSAQSSQADQATPTVTASSSSTPKKIKPPTFDGKSPPDSWIAHMTSQGWQYIRIRRIRINSTGLYSFVCCVHLICHTSTWCFVVQRKGRMTRSTLCFPNDR
jgi:hypothetical protein